MKHKIAAWAAAATLLLTTAAQAQVTITDIGASAPTPGANDISQLVYGNVAPAGLNYYWDNGTPPGQSFTTGSNPQGYVLTSLALQTSGNGGGNQFNSQTFTLRIYQLSGTGNSETPIPVHCIQSPSAPIWPVALKVFRRVAFVLPVPESW